MTWWPAFPTVSDIRKSKWKSQCLALESHTVTAQYSLGYISQSSLTWKVTTWAVNIRRQGFWGSILEVGYHTYLLVLPLPMGIGLPQRLSFSQESQKSDAHGNAQVSFQGKVNST